MNLNYIRSISVSHIEYRIVVKRDNHSSSRYQIWYNRYFDQILTYQ